MISLQGKAYIPNRISSQGQRTRSHAAFLMAQCEWLLIRNACLKLLVWQGNPKRLGNSGISVSKWMP